MEDVEINKKSDMQVVLTLMNLLEDFFKGRARSVLEITLLEEFPTTDVVLPLEKFSPRQIIESMMEKHRCTAQNIWENSENLKTLVFENNIQYTNNMEFSVDIYTICFYYDKILKYNIQNKLMQDIMELIINKYGINTEPQTENGAINLDPTAITFRRIAYSFPSVMLDMFYLGSYSIFLRKIFADFKLPSIIFSPVIVSILPKLNDPPIAILTTIALKLNDMCSGVNPDSKTPLAIIYQRVLLSYTSTVFPERLKLQLCKKWRIVVVKENEYNFHPIFKVHRKKAKQLISTLRLGDPDLGNILSRV